MVVVESLCTTLGSSLILCHIIYGDCIDTFAAVGEEELNEELKRRL